MENIIIIKKYDCHFSNDSMEIIGTAESIEHAEELIDEAYGNDYMIVQNRKNQVFIEDLSGDFTEFAISYDSYKINELNK